MLNIKILRAIAFVTGAAIGALGSAQPVIADPGFELLRSFYATDAHLPLEITVKSDAMEGEVRRVDFSYASFDKEIVPARLEVPQGLDNPPVIILLHGLSQSREQWWRTDDGPYSFPSRHRAALIEAGFAVLAIDARAHGERRSDTDFDNPVIYLERAYFDASRKIIAETAIDVRRGIDALEAIKMVDTNQIGVAGFSMGAFIGYLATAVESRIDAGMIMAMPFLPVSKGQAASFTSQFAYADGIGARPMGFIVGTQDGLYTREAVEALAGTLPRKPQVTWVESDHDLPEETAAVSVSFFQGVF